MKHNKFKVSFCVPVYNCGKIGYDLAMDLLSNDNINFQVVVSDDCSNDDTIKWLKKISDSRFKLVENKEKQKGLGNWLQALNAGDGCYLYLVMGRDCLRSENIDYLIKKLDGFNKANIVCIRDRKCISTYIYNKIEAYKNLIDCEHPTGTIFRRNEFQNLKNRKKYFENAYIYPENYIKRDLIFKYKSGMADFRVYSSKRYGNKKKNISHVESHTKVQYFFPEKRILEVLSMLRAILKDKELSNGQKLDIFCQKAEYMFFLVSEAWKNACLDDKFCGHYEVKVRTVGKVEQLKNIFTAYGTLKQYYKKEEWYNEQMLNKIFYKTVSELLMKGRCL